MAVVGGQAGRTPERDRSNHVTLPLTAIANRTRRLRSWVLWQRV